MYPCMHVLSLARLYPSVVNKDSSSSSSSTTDHDYRVFTLNYNILSDAVPSPLPSWTVSANRTIIYVVHTYIVLVETVRACLIYSP